MSGMTEGMAKEIMNIAIKTWGIEPQIDIAIEEMSELIKELIKQKRYGNNQKNIAEEIADVKIMMEQLMIIFDCEKEVAVQTYQKMDRLQKRLTPHE